MRLERARSSPKRHHYARQCRLFGTLTPFGVSATPPARNCLRGIEGPSIVCFLCRTHRAGTLRTISTSWNRLVARVVYCRVSCGVRASSLFESAARRCIVVSTWPHHRVRGCDSRRDLASRRTTSGTSSTRRTATDIERGPYAKPSRLPREAAVSVGGAPKCP